MHYMGMDGMISSLGLPLAVEAALDAMPERDRFIGRLLQRRCDDFELLAIRLRFGLVPFRVQPTYEHLGRMLGSIPGQRAKIIVCGLQNKLRRLFICEFEPAALAS